MKGSSKQNTFDKKTKEIKTEFPKLSDINNNSSNFQEESQRVEKISNNGKRQSLDQEISHETKTNFKKIKQDTNESSQEKSHFEKKTDFNQLSTKKEENDQTFEVFLNGASAEVNEVDIKNHFHNCQIRSIKFLKSKKNNNVRPKCFIRFLDFNSLQKALTFDNTLLKDCRINVSEVKNNAEKQITKLDKMSQNIESSKILVRNLSDGIDDEKLKAIFESIGGITESKVVRETNGKSKGYGFVDFSSPEYAKKALLKTGTEIEGKMIGVVLSVPKVNQNVVDDGKFRINRGNYYRRPEGSERFKPEAKIVKSEFQGEFYDL